MQLIPCAPKIVACDVNPPSKLARKFRAAFRAKLFFPTHSLSQIDKLRIARHFDSIEPLKQPKNAHERDALAAAVKAFHRIENKLRQVSAKARGRTEEGIAQAQARVLEGKQMKQALQ